MIALQIECFVLLHNCRRVIMLGVRVAGVLGDADASADEGAEATLRRWLLAVEHFSKTYKSRPDLASCHVLSVLSCDR